MPRSVRQRWVRRMLISAVSAVVLLLGACWFFGVWRPRDITGYLIMSRECHPVWKDLALRRMRAGHSLENLIARTAPARVERFGRYAMVNYQSGLALTGVTVVARDGRLVSGEAWSCTFHHTFFNSLGDVEAVQCGREYLAWGTAQRAAAIRAAATQP
jgi:hypothetical protein